MSVEESVCEIALRIADLVVALGEAPINRLSGAWTHQVDRHWFVAANGHREPVQIPDTDARMGFDIQPFDFAVWYNGWLAGTFNSFGEGVIAGGDGANEVALLAALNTKIESLGASQAKGK